MKFASSRSKGLTPWCTHRIYLSYHTDLQVILGFFIGTALALPFHLFVETVIRPLYPPILRTSLAKFMLLRDSAKVPNVFQQEYLWYADFKEADGKTAIGKERSKKTE